jgi:hypothetical protein
VGARKHHRCTNAPFEHSNTPGGGTSFPCRTMSPTLQKQRGINEIRSKVVLFRSLGDARMNRTTGRSPFPTLIVLVAALLFTRMIVPASATNLRFRFLSRYAPMDVASQQTILRFIPRGKRWLQNVPTVATPTCNTIRTTSFTARLDLNYYYMVEMDGQHDVVSGIEDAIRHAIIEALDSCDAQDRPVYEISLESVHAIATDGKKLCVQRLLCDWSGY